ncbi:helix-turn-helix domain-containing protein [Luteococcus sp. H138]|uniref:helix-turn-helix domain-containing protein n=1 Tax=unclassified Luteococcus TaxID=2639923 RepID=UPI00313AEC65
MSSMSTGEVAQRLGVSRTVVARLIADGSLPAEKVGGSWVVDADDVGRVADARRGRARPMSPRMAAGFLDVMARAEGDSDVGHFLSLSATERHRLRTRLDRLVAANEPAKLLRSWLSKRHPIHRFTMRGSADEILQQYRWAAAAAGALHPRLGLAMGSVIDLHLTQRGARGLVEDFWLEQDPRGPVRIHVQEEPRVDLAAALADVADLGGPREDHAVAEVIRSWR